VTVSDHRDLVTALLGVPGVAEAALEPGENEGDLGSLRLQLAPGVDEVAVAGAVNELLRERFGLAVDTDRVRVLDEPDAPAQPSAEAHEPAGGRKTPDPFTMPSDERFPSMPQVQMARPSRVTIDRVKMVTANLGVVATVQLGLDGSVYEGSAEGAATVGSVHRSVATAALRAIESVVDGRVRFDVEHLEVAVAGRDRTVLVVLTMVTGRGTERLSGASVVREDVRQAVIRAVLAAVNRRIEPLLDPQSVGHGD
jgi:hypothetical protein